MKKQNGKKGTKEHLNDLLLPIIFTLCVLPFVVYLAEYDYGYSKYPWHSDNSTMQDLYTYYRAIFFLVIVFFAVVILAFCFALYRERIKRVQMFLPLAVYAVFVLLSAAFSDNPRASWLGNFVDYEGVFVLLGYLVICFYTYQIMGRERDCRSVVHAVMVMFIPMSIVGWFQVFKHDLLNYEWVQRLVMSDELYGLYGGTVEDVFSGNNVFLTLYNPNYAAIFLVMFSCVFAVFLLGAKERKEKVIWGLFLADALILTWFTYTRAALVALVVVGVMLVLCMAGKKGGRMLCGVLLCGGVLFAILFAADAALGGKYIGRLLDEPKDDGLEAVLTTAEGVEITCDGETYVFSLREEEALKAEDDAEDLARSDAVVIEDKAYQLVVSDEAGNEIAMEQTKDGDLILPFSREGRATVLEWDGLPQIMLWIDDKTMQFEKRAAGYYYFTEWGKLDSMVEIPHADFHGLEYLGSGRLYIWSRILPMLKNYLIIGSGPETFAEVYPQNDYVGKMIYAENAGRIMERAHNDFLMRWVQTGLLSLLALLVFYVLFLKKCYSHYRGCTLETTRDKLGFGCFLGCVGYLVCCFFSDSTLYTTPVFYVFVGIALASVD